VDRLQHRLPGADRLDDGVRAEPVRELLDPLDALVAALLDDLGRAELARQALPLIAMTRSAPSCFVASTASSPTAPSPTTATVLPGPASAATAPNQPVPSTSEAASRLGIRSSAGISGVATRVPSAKGMRSRSACAPSEPIGTRLTQALW
jgi:hypothetical protein